MLRGYEGSGGETIFARRLVSSRRIPKITNGAQDQVQDQPDDVGMKKAELQHRLGESLRTEKR